MTAPLQGETRFPRDPVMQQLEARLGPYALQVCPDAWEALASAVVYQQVSGKAAANTCLRLRAAWNRFPTPSDILAAAPGALRGFRMTDRKEATLRELARAIRAGRLDLAALAEKHETVLHHVLGQYVGVGPWTVEMWMVFHLGREDVFMPGDLGLRKAIQREYELATPPSPREAVAIAERWRPFRTVASWYLWKSLPDFPEPGFGTRAGSTA